MSLVKSCREIIDHVEKSVIGQPRAIKQLERTLKIAQSGLRETDRPLAILMFAGPTGTGKSEAVRALAEAIHGDPNALCRIDANQLTQSHSGASLTGSPPGYLGSEEGHTMFVKTRIEGYPGRPGLLVLEEIEKAHPVIFDTLLGIFDKGVLKMVNGKGIIDFSNCIIVMTSNAGARHLADAASGKRVGFAPAEVGPHELSGDERKSIVDRELKLLFKPEFLNRIDDVVVFRWLAKLELDLIVSKFLDQLGVRLEKLSHQLTSSQSAKDFLVAHGTDIPNGARPLKRAIRRYLEDPIAELIVDGLDHRQVNFRINHYLGDEFLSITQEEIPYVEPPVQPAAELVHEPDTEVATAVNAQQEEREEPHFDDHID